MRATTNTRPGVSSNGSLKPLLRTLQQLFQQTGNPLFLWNVYQICRETNTPFPSWVLKAFDEQARRLDDVQNRDPDLSQFTHEAPYREWKKATLTAFGFNLRKYGGESDPFRAKLRAYDDLHLAIRVRVLVDGPEKLEPLKATAYVARKEGGCGNSETTVRTAWKKFGNIARAFSLQQQLHEIQSLDVLIEQARQRDGAGAVYLGRPVVAKLRCQRARKRRTVVNF
jgi:hypothetical protein